MSWKSTLVLRKILVVWQVREKAMAPHSSTLAWKVPWMEEPGGLQSKGALRVRHKWTTSLSLFTFMHERGKWQPTSVFLPGESQGRGSLVGCRLWGRTESDTTQVTLHGKLEFFPCLIIPSEYLAQPQESRTGNQHHTLNFWLSKQWIGRYGISSLKQFLI